VKDATPTKGQLRDALESLLKHLGEMPYDWPSHGLRRAYSEADELLYPDEFNQRFRANQRIEE
jgi:hypothetical protein